MDVHRYSQVHIQALLLRGTPFVTIIYSLDKSRGGNGIYLIPFAPHAFVLAVSGGTQKPAYAIGVPNDINAFHYYTVRSSFLFAPLVLQFQKTVSQLS